MRRFFNTAGPCNGKYHYMIPAERRLPDARRIIDRMGYIVVHAPRQTGKTTTLLALAASLSAEGRFAAVHTTCETAKVARDDFGVAEDIILATLRSHAEDLLPESLRPPPWPEVKAGARIQAALTAWSRSCPRPLVIVFDEIDALRGEALASVLGQLRAGYHRRPDAAPWSVVLCGLRDVRDYKMAAGGGEPRAGSSSPFNIKLRSLRIGDFTEDEVRALFTQHTEETGQPFTHDAIARVWDLGRGQPWLTNALGAETTDEMGIDETEPITEAHIDEAKERIILTRQTHLDSLSARLGERRVRRIIEPLVAGEHIEGDAYNDDLQFVRDLGLIAGKPPVRMANPIYREVIIRALAGSAEESVTVDPRVFVSPDGRLDFELLLREFQSFWIEHGEVLAHKQVYHEVAPQLVLMAFLQRVVNGGGYIDREYGVSRGRIDLLVRWPYADAGGKRRWQREAIELKVRAAGRADPKTKGLSQLDGYLDGLQLDTGTLVLFDRRPEAPPIHERTHLEHAVTPSGRQVRVLQA